MRSCFLLSLELNNLPGPVKLHTATGRRLLVFSAMVASGSLDRLVVQSFTARVRILFAIAGRITFIYMNNGRQRIQDIFFNYSCSAFIP